MGYLIESLTKKEGKIGVVFISHSSKNFENVKNQIINQFSDEGIEYFISAGQISIGDDFKKVINYHLDGASCGVVVLSSESLHSSWVWYEMGWLLAKQRCLFYVLGDIENEDDKNLIQSLAGKENYTNDFNILKEKLKKYTPVWGRFGPDGPGGYNSHRDILTNLKQARITISFSLPLGEAYTKQKISESSLSFGYQLVRFGKEDFVKHLAYDRYKDHWLEEGKCYYGKVEIINNTEDQEGNAIRIKADCIIPIHKILGVTFLPFFEVKEPLSSEMVKKAIEPEKFEVVVTETSIRTNITTIYFLLPMEEKRGRISENNKRYNYIYPL